MSGADPSRPITGRLRAGLRVFVAIQQVAAARPQGGCHWPAACWDAASTCVECAVEHVRWRLLSQQSRTLFSDLARSFLKSGSLSVHDFLWGRHLYDLP